MHAIDSYLGTTDSEDCLYLNLFAPRMPAAGPSGPGKAVLVWMFGGGLQFGDASSPLYDGAPFAINQDVIVVSPNYRTNGEFYIALRCLVY